MPSTVSVARSWPPAPIVEDEAESVLHEIFEDGSAVNRDDVSIVSRGSVDQYPILVPVEVQEPFPALADSNGNHTWNVKASHTTLNAGSAAPRSGSLSRASSISGPHSTKKKTNKVRFAEPVHDCHKPKVQPGWNPLPLELLGSMTNVLEGVEYLPVPASYARESSGAQDHDTYQRRPSRSEVDQLTRNSRRYSQRPAENYNNLDDVRQSTRRLSWNTWEEEDQDGNVSWIKERKYEWHSDDEISSYRGTHYKHWRESSRIVTERISTEVSPVRSSSQRYIDAPDRSRDRGAINGSNESVASSTGRRTSTMNGAAASAAKYNNVEKIRRGENILGLQLLAVARKHLRRGEVTQFILKHPQTMMMSVRHNRTYPSGLLQPFLAQFSRPRSSSDGIRRSEDSPKFSLSPCPRSIPMAGYREWYKFIGLTHLDICPSCASQIEATRFRDLFIPSLPKPADAKIRSSFSHPRARLAFSCYTKLLDLQSATSLAPAEYLRYNLGIASQISRRDETISDFNACSACFRNLSILMPSLRDSFRPGPIGQERICDLRTDSTRFIQYLDLFDAAVTRSFHDPHRYIDLRDFIRYAKRKNKMYDCPRDHIVVGSWHYIPELPEFTICEDCYDDVVWPIANGPIANRITRTLQRLPGGGKQASCYLYSPRMRAKFREAVKLGDFGSLKAAVLKRYGVETKFRERKKLLLEDVARGYDRDRDLRLNAEGWKRNE
ncbi:hypothetical protein CIHG_05639 [Coccidioides immitis H538.4]|uniref:Uncharacterized protein n=1 Tax=Coccidioides immitis H538.4 TaxID=396776 RepID=A0A0J8RSW7_COCIT|nr:hypothetical protein CIHG_05639 [Coccidioides immitis H538.4]